MRVQFSSGPPFKYMTNWKELNSKRHKERRNWAIILLGGICKKCNSIYRLEFDHINPENKTFTISKFLTHSKEKLEQELKKCQLLCYSCHKEKNKVDNGEARHGTQYMYGKYKCRCEACKIAWSNYSAPYKRIWRKKRKELGFKPT